MLSQRSITRICSASLCFLLGSVGMSQDTEQPNDARRGLSDLPAIPSAPLMLAPKLDRVSPVHGDVHRVETALWGLDQPSQEESHLSAARDERSRMIEQARHALEQAIVEGNEERATDLRRKIEHLMLLRAEADTKREGPVHLMHHEKPAAPDRSELPPEMQMKRQIQALMEAAVLLQKNGLDEQAAGLRKHAKEIAGKLEAQTIERLRQAAQSGSTDLHVKALHERIELMERSLRQMNETLERMADQMRAQQEQ